MLIDRGLSNLVFSEFISFQSVTTAPLSDCIRLITKENIIGLEDKVLLAHFDDGNREAFDVIYN
jgi:hypothetical protein